MSVRFTVVGVPGERRTELFSQAVRARGLPAPAVLPWRELLIGDPVLPAETTHVRVDSPGGDVETDALLRGAGDPTRVDGGALWYSRLTGALRRVAELTAGRARLLNDPEEIGVMFDKRRCHARLAAAGVPVPPALPEVTGYRELRERMADAGWNRVFVKPAHGSSASGVIALTARGDRITATTSAALGPAGLHNSLRVRTYTDPRDVAAVVDRMAPDGLHVERWFPKAGLGGRSLDLRVVVTAGRPTHAVVRTSRIPITNLHLGGARGDLPAVRARLGERGWQAALEVCVRAAACFPRSLAAGVDLMIGSDWQEFAVAEVNAFGDLLPGLDGLPGGGSEGLDTYAAQVEAVLCTT
ncbi:STM4014 family protein [Rhizohabitans arisaemae]|uniref:STM4014 family protein n=1 Tax=Rhizohabitans arisaemae TaxID=2720610 RepID=UPI0024B1FD92|nr:STM4014 family protein [Rhizohabitans arisaemae]